MKTWTIEYYNHSVQDWICEMPVGIRAFYARLTALIMEFGMILHMPHSRAMGNGLFELRPKGNTSSRFKLGFMVLELRGKFFMRGMQKSES